MWSRSMARYWSLEVVQEPAKISKRSDAISRMAKWLVKNKILIYEITLLILNFSMYRTIIVIENKLNLEVRLMAYCSCCICCRRSCCSKLSSRRITLSIAWKDAGVDAVESSSRATSLNIVRYSTSAKIKLIANTGHMIDSISVGLTILDPADWSLSTVTLGRNNCE